MNMELLHSNKTLCLQTNSGADELIYDGKVLKYSTTKFIATIDILLDNGEHIYIENYISTLKNLSFITSKKGQNFWIYANREECYKFLLSKHKAYAKATEWKDKKRHEMLLDRYKFLLDNINNPYI